MNKSKVDSWASERIRDMTEDKKQGYSDCENGLMPKEGKTEEYYLGYGARHQEESIRDARTRNER
jgi:hypothetical protein